MAVDWVQIRKEHGPLVWSVAWRILNHHADALDCAQEVFIEAFERSERLPITDWGAFLRWLTTRRAIDSLRRKQRTKMVTSPRLDSVPQYDSPCETLQSEEVVQLVREQLMRVPERQATAFWLVCVEEMSYRDVAAQMNIEVNAVGVLVHRARQHLKTVLVDLRVFPTETR